MRAAALFALVALAGCAPEESFTTPLAVRVPLPAAISCRPGTGYTTWVLDLFRYRGVIDDVAPPAGTRCARCAEGEAECELLERICRCSGPRTTPEGIESALRGSRFEDLPPDVPLCVRLVAIEGAPTGPAEGPGETCACPDLAEADLCALSQVGSVNESGAPLQLTQLICREAPRLDGGTIDCAMLAERCDETRLARWCDPLERLCDAYVGPSRSQCATFGVD